MKMIPGKGRDGRIRVWYMGELFVLSKLAEVKGCHPGTAIVAWGRQGKPDEVNDEFFGKLRANRPAPGSAKRYTVDGVKYTSRQMCTEFGISQPTFDNRRKRYGKTDYTRAELVDWKRSIEQKKEKAERDSKWRRGPSVGQAFGHDMTAEERANLRLMCAW